MLGRHIRHILSNVGLEKVSLIDVLCEDATANYFDELSESSSQSKHASTPSLDTVAAADVVGSDLAHIRATVNDRECVVTSDYRRELQLVLMSQLLVSDVTKYVCHTDTHVHTGHATTYTLIGQTCN